MTDNEHELLIPYWEDSDEYETIVWLHNTSATRELNATIRLLSESVTDDESDRVVELRVAAPPMGSINQTLITRSTLNHAGIGFVNTDGVVAIGEVMLRSKDGLQVHRFRMLPYGDEYLIRSGSWHHTIRLFSFSADTQCELLYCRWPTSASPYRPAKWWLEGGTEVGKDVPRLTVAAGTRMNASIQVAYPGRLLLSGHSGRLVYGGEYGSPALHINAEGPMWFGTMTRYAGTADSFESEILT